MTVRFHKNDLPDLGNYAVEAVAIDTETLGLNPHRDRLCVVQISPGDGTADVIQIAPGQREAPNLVSLLGNSNIAKLFHYGRFDHRGALPRVRRDGGAGVLHQDRLAPHPHLYRPPWAEGYCAELLGVDLSKIQQSSDWGADELTRNSSNTLRPTCSICTGCARCCRHGWRARAARRRPTPASASCRPAQNST